jgi:hypothetical protein
MTSMAWMAQGQRLEVEVPPADAGSARKHLQLKRYCTTAVCPRGAQVRSRCGASLNPLLSIKTTVRFSESLFLMCGQLAFFRSAEPCANVIGCNYEHFSPQCGSFTRLHTILFGSTKLGLFASSRLARLLCWKALLRGKLAPTSIARQDVVGLVNRFTLMVTRAWLTVSASFSAT